MRDVAGKAGVSQPFLSDLENGRAMPSITTLYRLADTFDLTPQDLLPSLQGDDVVVVRAGAETRPVDGSPGGPTPDRGSRVTRMTRITRIDQSGESESVATTPSIPSAAASSPLK